MTARETLVGEEDAGENPHRHHDQVDEPAGGFDFLRAAGGEQSQPAERECADGADEQDGEQRAQNTHVKDQHAEAEHQADFDDHEDKAAAGDRQQEIAAAHGSGDETLQQLALAHIHQREADAPHA